MHTNPLHLSFLAHSPIYGNVPTINIPTVVRFLAAFGTYAHLFPMPAASFHKCYAPYILFP